MVGVEQRGTTRYVSPMRARRWLRRCAVLCAVVAVPGIAVAQRPVPPQLSTWRGPSGALRPVAFEALHVLEAASDDGLSPDDYEADALAHRAATGIGPDGQFESDLTRSVLRYLRDVHMGRVNPRQVGFTLNVPEDGHDFHAWLLDAVREGTLAPLVARVRPQGDAYAALRGALRVYRQRDVPVPRWTSARAVRPGEPFEAAPALREFLRAVGDLPASPGTDGIEPPREFDAGIAGDATTTYDPRLVAGVVRFQRRHGLTADGVLGPRTRAALAVPLAHRVLQLELALERLRWLPHADAQRWLVVQVPFFEVEAWDGVPLTGVPAMRTGAVVGRAIDGRTPVFAATLSEVVFRPYWNVPRSIVRKELLPVLRRDSGYLAAHEMELVDGPGDDSRVVPASAAALDALAEGTVRLRQRPGAMNALGLVKLSFPNATDVYMHGTPAMALFSRARRDFSHGCIRLEDSAGVTTWALRDVPGWDRAAVERAMHATATTRVPLPTPVRVLVFYTTAQIDPETGDVRFAEDIYHHDARLQSHLKAVRARRASPRYQ